MHRKTQNGKFLKCKQSLPKELLRKEVKRRTRELEESYDEMKAYLDNVLAELKRDATIKGKYRK
ncbi:MAG: hypothetical protein M3156_07110 [Thermoproteota archaeon]|nr:hypothetical protein [Thermoproteota archaeon]